WSRPPAVVDHGPMTDSTPSPRQRALRGAVLDIERHVSSLGWDSPVLVFSLVRTADALAANPALVSELPDGAAQSAEVDPEHLLSVEQDGLPQADTIEELLAQLAWPAEVDGAAIVVERIVVPPEAETDMPRDPDAAVAYLEAHPDRQDVRIAVGVLRSGESWCVLRSRLHDSDDAVGGSPDAAPGLVEALRATLPQAAGQRGRSAVRPSVTASSAVTASATVSTATTSRPSGTAPATSSQFSTGARNQAAPSRAAPAIFCLIPPIGPTSPARSTVPVP